MSDSDENLGCLTTHVLDTALGRPARDLKISLFSVRDDNKHIITSDVTNIDGRLAKPILDGKDFKVGTYELSFDVLSYFEAKHKLNKLTVFYKKISIGFHINNAFEHYHVPLLLSPFGYTTYRGS